MRFELNNLRHALAVARHGSFSRAADELRLTQPALSRSIAAFEQRYGFRLFDRTSSGVVTTAVGTLVVAEAERLLAYVGDLHHNLLAYGNGDAGPISVGFRPLAASVILPSLASTLISERPGLELRAAIKPAEELLAGLLAGDMELVFAGRRHFESSPDVTVEPVGSIHLAIIVRSGHALAGQDGLTLASLRPFPCASAVDLPRLTGEAGAFVCNDFQILRDTVLKSDCFWLGSPDHVAAEIADGRLAALDVTDLPWRQSELCAGKRRGRSLSPAACATIESVKRICGSPAP